MELSNFKIDAWYKAICLAGAAACVAGVGLPLQLPNKPVALIGLGGFLFGIGQWIDHPLQSRIQPTVYGPMKGQGYPWKPSIGGILVQLGGMCAMAYGSWLLAGTTCG